MNQCLGALCTVVIISMSVNAKVHNPLARSTTVSQILMSLDHPGGCPHAPAEVSHRCLRMTWCSKVAKDRCLGKVPRVAQQYRATRPKNGQVIVFSRFFNVHLTGVVSLGPTGENKTGMRSSTTKLKVVEKNTSTDFGSTNLESPA